MARIWAFAVLAAGIWLLCAYGQHRPEAQGLNAPATSFSAARADAVLGRLLGDQIPHPAGSVENTAVRARLLKELAALGVPARTQTATSCFSRPRWGILSCGAITNIIADVSRGTGKQVVLMAHLDSVAAGPGAGDDMSGVATILEAIRALQARGLQGEHPIVALFSDGEESGLLGAQAFLRDPLQRAKTGAVINVEARGNRGPSYLFQTSPGDARLVDLYANSVSHFATSSLYAEIYKVLPNDTDLTPFLQAGLTGFNFAFIGNSAQYHTPLDRRENIEPASLQQHGDNVLGLADALSRADFEKLKGGDAIYLDVLGRWLPRLPRDWALPLSIALFVSIAAAGLLTQRARRNYFRMTMTVRPMLAMLMPPLLLAGCIGMGFALHGVAALVSGHADPSFATPLYLRLALAFGAFAVAVFTARWSGVIAGWLWFAAVAIACAIWLPGVTPYFLFPMLLAAPLLLLTMRGGRMPALFVAALAALIVWLGLAAGGEAIMGLKLHPLFMGSAAFALMPLLPLLRSARGGPWAASILGATALAIGFAVTAGLQPAFSDTAPQRLNLRYAEQDGKAFWLADPVERLPQSLRVVADFSAQPQRRIEMVYVAPAGSAQFTPPTAHVSRSGARLQIVPHTDGHGYLLIVPPDARLRAVTIGGITSAMAPGQAMISCATRDCGPIMLEIASASAQSLLLVEQRRGLPPEGKALLAARPHNAVPSQGGDRTLLAATVRIPAP